MAEYLVDVVAAAKRLQAAQKLAGEATAGGDDCPLGHANVAGARFCADCGLPLVPLDLGPRVDLEAVREAVQRPVSAEEQARRDREHAQVVMANAAAEQQVRDVTEQADPSARKVLVHFTDSGFTWGGKVWQRGEMLEIGPEHPRWDDAVKWIRLSKSEQYARYGRVFFDFGPWPGSAHAPGTEVPLDTAESGRWAHSQRGLPARSAGDGSSALVPF